MASAWSLLLYPALALALVVSVIAPKFIEHLPVRLGCIAAVWLLWLGILVGHSRSSE